MNFNQGLKMKEYEDNKSKPTPVAMVAPELKQNADATEITKTCAVLGCEESKNLNSDSFFPFPEDPSLRQIWTDLTGRNNWTPTDYSYICVQHFSVDCFECNADNNVVLVSKAVPSTKLPKHVLEVEYIEDEAFDNETDGEEEMEYEHLEEFLDYDQNESHLTHNGIASTEELNKTQTDNIEALKLFTEVQKMQKQAVLLKEKLKCTRKIHKRQNKMLMRLNEVIEIKKNLLKQKQKKRSRILLTLQDKMQEDTNGLVLAMPTKHTDDLKNFALSIYRYSPQAYIYVRNSLRTLLPSTDVLDTWVTAGYEPKNVLTNSNLVKVVSELTESELSCKVTLG